MMVYSKDREQLKTNFREMIHGQVGVMIENSDDPIFEAEAIIRLRSITGEPARWLRRFANGWDRFIRTPTANDNFARDAYRTMLIEAATK